MADGEDGEEDEQDLRWWVPVTFTEERNPYFAHTKPRTWLRPEVSLKVIIYCNV